MATTEIIENEGGELVEQELYVFDSDRGEVPEFDKQTLSGELVLIYGISEEPEEFPQGPVRFVKLLRQGEKGGSPWGVMFPAQSAVVTQVERMVKRGQVPFAAKMEKVASKSHKGQSYWKLSRPAPSEVNA